MDDGEEERINQLPNWCNTMEASARKVCMNETIAITYHTFPTGRVLGHLQGAP